MSRQDGHNRDKMLQGSVRQSAWFGQEAAAAAAYSANRLPLPNSSSSYPSFNQQNNLSHNTMYDTLGSNVSQSTTHQISPSQITSTSWPNTFSDTTSYNHAAYFGRHQYQNNNDSNAGGLPSSQALPSSTTSASKPITTSRPSRVGGPRKTLTDEDRRDICLYHRRHPDKKQTEIGEVFGVERSTISKILRQKEKYLGEEGGPLSRLVSQVDQSLLTWALERERGGARLTPDMLKRQGRMLANARRLDAQAMAELDNPTWISDFLRRHTNLTSFQYPQTATSSSIPDPSIPSLRPSSFDPLPSLVPTVPSHASTGRVGLTSTFGMSPQSTTFNTIMPSYGPLNTTNYGYGTTGTNTRINHLYAPVESSSVATSAPSSSPWTAPLKPNRNYILSSTNPDPAGQPPGPSPTLRSFNTSMLPIPSTSTPPVPSLYQSYRPTYSTTTAMADTAPSSSPAHLSVIPRGSWSNEPQPQTQTISPYVQPQNHLQLPHPSFSSRSNSAALSSTPISDSPHAHVAHPIIPSHSHPHQQPTLDTSTIMPLDDETRAFSVLMNLIETDASDVTAGGQEPIRDMTVGRLLERLNPGGRGQRMSPGNDGDGEMLARVSSRSQRRRGEDGALWAVDGEIEGGREAEAETAGHGLKRTRVE